MHGQTFSIERIDESVMIKIFSPHEEGEFTMAVHDMWITCKDVKAAEQLCCILDGSHNEHFSMRCM